MASVPVLKKPEPSARLAALARAGLRDVSGGSKTVAVLWNGKKFQSVAQTGLPALFDRAALVAGGAVPVSRSDIGLNVRVVVSEDLSHFQMCLPEEGDTDEDREYSLRNQIEESRVKVENLVLASMENAYNQPGREDSKPALMFGCDRLALADIQSAQKALKWKILSVEPWHAALARGCSAAVGLDSSNQARGYFIAGAVRSWFMVERDGELQFAETIGAGRKEFGSALLKELPDSVSMFNKRISLEYLASVAIVCAVEDQFAANSIALRLSEASIDARVHTVEFVAGESLPEIVALRGGAL